jgi:aspartate 1-decarboxylase
MTRNMLKSKIHRARVTGVHLDYEGSVTIDKDLLKEADILPYEQVNVLNVNTGVRFTTYAIEGKSGAGQIDLNGAAARLAAKGDIVIILTYTTLPNAEAVSFMPRLVYVNSENKIVSTKRVIGTLELGE